MPQVFRAMRKDDDGFPTLEQLASALGVRPGVDIDLDPQGNVLVNKMGMSVNPGHFLKAASTGGVGRGHFPSGRVQSWV